MSFGSLSQHSSVIRCLVGSQARARTTEMKLKQQAKQRREKRSRRLQQQLVESSNMVEEDNKRVSHEQESLADRVDDLTGWLEERNRQLSLQQPGDVAADQQVEDDDVLLPNQTDGVDSTEQPPQLSVPGPVGGSALAAPSALENPSGRESPSLPRVPLLRSPAVFVDTITGGEGQPKLFTVLPGMFSEKAKQEGRSVHDPSWQ